MAGILQRSHSPSLAPAEPLWQRVPTRDEAGRPLSDFMMLIPRLSQRPQNQLTMTLHAIERVLVAYEHAVMFADLNLKLNLLWVSVRPTPGICLELSAAIKLHVPEALLVGHNPEHFARAR
jgi:hypothetical protein